MVFDVRTGRGQYTSLRNYIYLTGSYPFVPERIRGHGFRCSAVTAESCHRTAVFAGCRIISPVTPVVFQFGNGTRLFFLAYRADAFFRSFFGTCRILYRGPVSPCMFSRGFYDFVGLFCAALELITIFLSVPFNLEYKWSVRKESGA